MDGIMFYCWFGLVKFRPEFCHKSDGTRPQQEWEWDQMIKIPSRQSNANSNPSLSLL